MKFVIVTPRQKWGGAIALHVLYQNLINSGHDATIFYTEVYSYKKSLLKRINYWRKWLLYCLGDYKEQKKEPYDWPIKKVRRKYIPFVSKDTIVVYPDTVYGNPLYAKNVVRYFLYYNRFPDDDKAYGDNDLFICYRKQFNDWKLNPNGYELHIPYFDLDLYKRTNFGERKGTCYIIRKGKHREDLPKSFDGPIIDDMTEENKVSIFNSCERCISYDTQTAYSSIAAMCGCLSIVVPEKGKGRNDYLKDDDVEYGVAFGFSDDEIAYAMNTANRVKELYEKQNAKGIEEVKKFVNICEEYFG